MPLHVLVDKFSHMRFEPSGMTRNPQIRFAKSIVDYVFRWLATKFLSAEAQFRAGVNGPEPAAEPRPRSRAAQLAVVVRGGRAGAARAAVAAEMLDGAEPGRRAALQRVRRDHGAQRQLLQVRQLRQHVGCA